jgi:lysophospholipase L1-like esterase
MKRLLLVCLLSLILGAVVAQAEPIVKTGDRVAFRGDSITEQRLYSKYLELYLLACVPQTQVITFDFGYSLETAAGFDCLFPASVMPFKPTLVTLCFGMNDGTYKPFTAAIGKSYEDPMRDMVTRLKAAGATVLVGGPGIVDPSNFGIAYNITTPPAVYNDNLGQLSEIARKVAADNGMPFVDVHAALLDATTKARAALGDKWAFTPDGIHPFPNGHIVMAYAFLKAMGFDGDLGTITVDMKGAATATGGHKVLGGTNGKAQIESTRWPFCFTGKHDDPHGAVSMLPYVPFNQDLNRLTLVVKNLDAAQGKVTWGGQSKTFPKADLEKGINLAAEFLDNPFLAAFQKLDDAVSQKGQFEAFMFKQVIAPWWWGRPFMTSCGRGRPSTPRTCGRWWCR